MAAVGVAVDKAVRLVGEVATRVHARTGNADKGAVFVLQRGLQHVP